MAPRAFPTEGRLRQACGLTTDDRLDVANAEVRATVADALDGEPSDAEVVRVTAGLVHLLGYAAPMRDVDPARASDEATRSLVDFVEALGRKHPLVLILSDLHWADDVVLALLGEVLARLGRERVVVLGTARDDLINRWQPPVGRANSIVLHLDPLGLEASGKLLDALATNDPRIAEQEMLSHVIVEKMIAALQGGKTKKTSGEPSG